MSGDDIVTRLRSENRMALAPFHMSDAAVEIERLNEWRTNALLALDKRESIIATLTAEIERLRAEASFWEREHQREQDAWRAERALADQLAEALGQALCGDDEAIDLAITAIAAWEEARREQ